MQRCYTAKLEVERKMRRDLDHKITGMGASNVFNALGKDLVKRLKTYIKLLKTYKEEEKTSFKKLPALEDTID